MELNIGIICASLPTLRALLAKHFPNTFTSSISPAHQAYGTGGTTHRDLLSINRDSQLAGMVIMPNALPDVEKSRGETFLASDSEAENRLQPLEDC
jgi:hypothetical protein